MLQDLQLAAPADEGPLVQLLSRWAERGRQDSPEPQVSTLQAWHPWVTGCRPFMDRRCLKGGGDPTRRDPAHRSLLVREWRCWLMSKLADFISDSSSRLSLALS